MEITAADYATLEDARTARAEVVSRVDTVLFAESTGQSSADALVQLRTDAVAHFAALAPSLPRLTNFTPRAVRLPGAGARLLWRRLAHRRARHANPAAQPHHPPRLCARRATLESGGLVMDKLYAQSRRASVWGWKSVTINHGIEQGGWHICPGHYRALARASHVLGHPTRRAV